MHVSTIFISSNVLLQVISSSDLDRSVIPRKCQVPARGLNEGEAHFILGKISLLKYFIHLNRPCIYY